MNCTNIKELRKKSKHTQKELSDILGISERNYRAKENGELPFNQIEIIQLIKIYNLQKEELYELFYINAFQSTFWKNNLIKFKKQ